MRPCRDDVPRPAARRRPVGHVERQRLGAAARRLISPPRRRGVVAARAPPRRGALGRERLAMARPMPRDAPVTRAIRPSIPPITT